jgi:hypothetical protein
MKSIKTKTIGIKLFNPFFLFPGLLELFVIGLEFCTYTLTFCKIKKNRLSTARNKNQIIIEKCSVFGNISFLKPVNQTKS